MERSSLNEHYIAYIVRTKWSIFLIIYRWRNKSDGKSEHSKMNKLVMFMNIKMLLCLSIFGRVVSVNLIKKTHHRTATISSVSCPPDSRSQYSTVLNEPQDLSRFFSISRHYSVVVRVRAGEQSTGYNYCRYIYYQFRQLTSKLVQYTIHIIYQ